MRFDLHVHSNFSDGQDSVEAVLRAALRRGLYGLSITDHDTLGGSQKALKIIREETLDLVLIPGAEVTTSGLIFTAFQASIADQFIPVQRNLDQLDALNEWTTAIGSAVFAIPPGFQPDGYLGEGLLG